MHAAIDHERLLAVLWAEGAAIVAAASAGEASSAAVPTCPGWTVADVVRHLARVYGSVAEIVATRRTDPPGPLPQASSTASTPASADRGALDDFAAAHRSLVDALGAVDAATPVWTWSDDHTAGFYQRRITHETAVHRVDVELALGRSFDPFDSDVAADGIDELYTVVLPFGLARKPATNAPQGTLHLHRTDGPGEWTLDLTSGALTVGHVHGKATAAVRGPASDLFVFAWNRGRAPSLEVFGDESVAAAWAALAP